MNLTGVWDWEFFWQMVRNNVSTGSPFVMIVAAVAVALMLLGGIVSIVRNRKA